MGRAYNMSESFWTKFERWANSLKIDSVSIAGVRVGFRSDAYKSPAYDQIISIIKARGLFENDVFIASAHNVDEVYRIDILKSDHECESPVYIASPGGSGANTAFALGRMGWEVHIAGVVGFDGFGDLIRNSLDEANVKTSLLRSSDIGETGRTVTIVEDSGRRLIVVRPGINDYFHDQISFEELIFCARKCKIFHSSSFVSPQTRSLQERLLSALSGEMVTSLTPGALYAREGLDRVEGLLRHTNVMFLYKEQLVELIEKSSARSYLKGSDTQALLSAYFAWKERRGFAIPQILVVKDPLQVVNGMLGQTFLSAGAGCSNLEAFVPPRSFSRKVVYRAEDTTGVGDCSAAGMIHAMLQASSFDHAVDTAFLLAALASTEIGARGALRDGMTQIRKPDPLSLSAPSR